MSVPKVTPCPENMLPWTRNTRKMTLAGTNGPQKYSKMVDVSSNMEDLNVIPQH